MSPDVINAPTLKSIYEDRLNKLPEVERAELKRILDELDHRAPSSGFGRVDTPLEAVFEGVQSGISAGHVHSWQCFLTPEAARQWNALVENGNYAMYSTCLATLEELLQAKQWKAVVGDAYNVGVALAGGGSPEKDALLAGALARATQNKIQYWLIDVSNEMMTHSQRGISRLLRQADLKSLAHRIELKPGKRIDILKLPLYFRRPLDWSRTVWAVLGGTIGNLPECEFFDSISVPSRPGDLMIVGLDTHEGETWDGFQERIRNQYQGEEVYELLLEGRHGRDRDVQITFREAINRDVPDSWIAEFRARCDGQEVVVTSTRYLLDEFLKYASKRGWEHLHTVAASESTFRQVLLRRT